MGAERHTDYPLGFGEELIWAAPAVVYEVTGSNETGLDLWIAIFDQTTTPVDGDLPVETYLVNAGTSFSRTFPGPLSGKGRRLSNGLAMAWSTTKGFLTSTGGGSVGTGFVAWREV